MVCLDGGEFSTMGDWETLQCKGPKVVALDDVHAIKCHDIKSDLLAAGGELVFYDPERNGSAIILLK